MSPRKFVVPVSAMLVGTGLAALGTAPPARADVTTGAATAALDLPAGVTIAGFAGAPATRAVADTGVDANAGFNDFPSKGDSYLLLSTGQADSVFEGTPASQLSTDFGNDFAPDTSTVTLTVAQGTPAGCLFVDFAMGTEEALGYAESVPDDVLSIASNGEEYAENAGAAYFSQSTDSDPEPEWPTDTSEPYHVNQIDYWHKPGDPLDPVPGTPETPSLPAVTGLNHVTVRDTARVPLSVAGGAQTVTISVADAPEGANGDLDSVAFLDDVRLANSCSGGVGVEPHPANQDTPNSCCGVIKGIRGVGNALYYDPVPSTDVIEQYNDPRVPGDCAAGVPDHACGNGWRSPSGTPVELRFRWYRKSNDPNNGNMGGWTPIPHADRQTYVPTAVDWGKYLIVLVTGVVDGRRYETFPSTSSASTWYVTIRIDYGTFETDVAPVVNDTNGGGVAVGDRLVGQVGSMVPRQDTYDWQWLMRAPGTQAWTPISGATSQELTVGEDQAGKLITVRATARRQSFDSKSGTDETPVGPVEYLTWAQMPVPVVELEGTPVGELGEAPRPGQQVVADVGQWLPSPTSHSYRWTRNGVAIPGATNAGYVLQAADVGQNIRVEVSGVKTGYDQVPQPSPAFVPAGQPMPGAVPTIEGTPKVGVRLTGSVTGWNPTGSTLSYAWFAGDQQVGSTRSLTVPASAAGHPLVLRVTGVRTGYETTTRHSEPTAPVARGTLTAGTPRILGTARVGSTLSVARGSWSPAGIRFSYRWKVGSRLVSGPAGRRSTFRVPSTARGKRITVIVTGSLAGYTTVRRSSPPTARVTR